MSGISLRNDPLASAIKYCEPQRTQSSQSPCVLCDLCGRESHCFVSVSIVVSGDHVAISQPSICGTVVERFRPSEYERPHALPWSKTRTRQARPSRRFAEPFGSALAEPPGFARFGRDGLVPSVVKRVHVQSAAARRPRARAGFVRHVGGALKRTIGGYQRRCGTIHPTENL